MSFRGSSSKAGGDKEGTGWTKRHYEENQDNETDRGGTKTKV